MLDGDPLVLVGDGCRHAEDTAALGPDRQRLTQRGPLLPEIGREEAVRIFGRNREFLQYPPQVDPRTRAAGGVYGHLHLLGPRSSRGDDAISRRRKIDDCDGFRTCPLRSAAVQETAGRPPEHRFGHQLRPAAEGRRRLAGELPRQKDPCVRFAAPIPTARWRCRGIQYGLEPSVMGRAEFAPYAAVAPEAADTDIFDAGINQKGGYSLHTQSYTGAPRHVQHYSSLPRFLARPAPPFIPLDLPGKGDVESNSRPDSAQPWRFRSRREDEAPRRTPKGDRL